MGRRSQTKSKSRSRSTTAAEDDNILFVPVSRTLAEQLYRLIEAEYNLTYTEKISVLEARQAIYLSMMKAIKTFSDKHSKHADQRTD